MAIDETPETLREVAVSQDHVGFVCQMAGDLVASLASHEESLALRRRLLESQGGTAPALRDLSSSLNSVGRFRQETGDLAGSLQAYDESAAYARRLMKEFWHITGDAA